MPVKKKEIPVIPKRPKGRRKKFIVDDAMIAKVLELTKQGFLQKDLAAYFGTSPTYWSALCSENEDLWIATEQGKQFGHELASSKLMDLIKKDNLQAIIFYLKTRHRWTEDIPDSDEVKNSDEDKMVKKFKDFVNDLNERNRRNY